MSLTFDKHTRNICKASYFHIQGFRQVQRAMDQSTVNAVTCEIVGSRLDYYNALLDGMFVSNLDKLRVQNCLARVVTGERSRDHIKPVLNELHWLPNQARISKIVTLVHKEQITSHHILQISSSADHRGHFVLHQRPF